MARIPYENWKINHLRDRCVVKKLLPIFEEKMQNTFLGRPARTEPPF